MKRLLLFATILFLSSSVLFAQESKDEQTEDKDKFAELIKDAEHLEGFGDLHKTDDKLYMAVTEDDLNKEFLMNFEVARGIGSSGLYGGTMLNIFEGLLVKLEKREGKIFLVQLPHRYKAEEGTPEARTVELTYGNSVLETAKVEATGDDSVMLLDVYSWFVGDLSNISQRVQSAVSSQPGQPGRASLDKEKSYVRSMKSFPMNTNVVASLTFNNGERGAPRTVADGRFIPVSIHYTMATLHETPMEHRMADDRAG